MIEQATVSTRTIVVPWSAASAQARIKLDAACQPFRVRQYPTLELGGSAIMPMQPSEFGEPSRRTQEILREPVVDKAEDAHDEGAKIHKKKTSVMFGTIGLTPSVGRSSLWLNPSPEKLAHEVSILNCEV
jgi:hypothetical protein